MKLRVECYSGHKADQRPIKFWLGDVVHFVESIDDQWYGPSALYFRVQADDGNTYVRSLTSPGLSDPHLDPPSSVH
jgi:hypothetical protein